jgi:hypothetical protein
MFVFKKYNRQNHVWSIMTKYLRFLCKFTNWSGEPPTGNFSDVFLSVLSIIFLEDKHKILLHLSIFYEYQQFFQHRICFSIQPPDYSDPLPRLAHPSSFFLIRLFNKYVKFLNWIVFSWSCKVYNISFSDLNLWLWIHKVCLLHVLQSFHQ